MEKNFTKKFNKKNRAKIREANERAWIYLILAWLIHRIKKFRIIFGTFKF